MASTEGQTFTLPKRTNLAGDLFTTQQQRDDAQKEKVVDIPLSEIDEFPDHPFQVKMDDSIKVRLMNYLNGLKRIKAQIILP